MAKTLEEMAAAQGPAPDPTASNELQRLQAERENIVGGAGDAFISGAARGVLGPLPDL